MDYADGVSQTFQRYSIPSMFICSFGCLSQVTTFVLAIVRMISVYKPLFSRRYPYWIPLTYASVYGFLMFVNEISFAVFHHCKVNDVLEHAIDFTVEFCFYLNIVHFSFGILAALATILKILLTPISRSNKSAQVQHVKSCWTIFLMNVPYLFSIVNYTLCKTHLKTHGYFFLVYVAAPSFTSMFNPLVIVLLNTELQRYMKFWLCKKNRAAPTSAAIRWRRVPDGNTDGLKTGNTCLVVETSARVTWASCEF